MASKDKNSSKRAGNRKDRNQRFQVRTPILGYYLIVTDTDETEKNYFEGLKRSIPEEIRNRIVIRVEKAKTTYSLVERTRELCSTQAQQRIPWIVFDRDEVKDFDGIIREALESDIHVGWSNPCFEIWLYAYFGEMPNIHDSVSCCSRFSDRFEKETGHPYGTTLRKLLHFVHSTSMTTRSRQKNTSLSVFTTWLFVPGRRYGETTE